MFGQQNIPFTAAFRLLRCWQDVLWDRSIIRR